MEHPILGARLLECAKTLLAIEGQPIIKILGTPDDLKLKSSMTLFASISNGENIFNEVIDKYFNGKYDDATIRLLDKV